MTKTFFEAKEATCPFYIRTRDSQDDPHPRGKAFIEDLWGECSAYVDSNARAHARHDMPSVFWELYLAYALRRSGIQIVEQLRTRKNQRGPDLRTDNPDVWIEAVSPTCGLGEDALSQPRMGIAYSVPNNEYLLRLRTVFDTKAHAFKGYIADNVVPKSHATIIAISGAMLPTKYSEQPTPRLVKSLFGLGDQVVRLDRETGKSTGTYLSLKDEVRNAKGSVIRTDVFGTPHTRM